MTLDLDLEKVTYRGNLSKGAANSRLGHIPLHDGLVREPCLTAELDSAAAASSQSSDDDDSRLLSAVGLNSRVEGGLDVVAESFCVVEGWHRALGHARVQNLMRPGDESESSSSISRIEAKGGHAAAVLVRPDEDRHLENYSEASRGGVVVVVEGWTYKNSRS